MKKIISIFLTVIILASTLAVSASADGCDCEKTPVILVSGFGATTLAEVNEDGSKTVVFPPDISRLGKILGDSSGDFLKIIPAIIAAKENAENEPALWQSIRDAIYSILEGVCEIVAMNPDGTSKHNIVPVVEGAENTSYKAFVENEITNFIPYYDSEFLNMESIAAEVGDDHVFNFTFDWRFSHAENADKLDEYIQDVLELTGHSRVSIYSISQGCFLVGEYLYRYADKKQAYNVILDTPLLEGSNIVPDVYTRDTVKMNYFTWLDMLEEIIHTEIDVSALDSILPHDWIHKEINLACKDSVVPTVKEIVSFWEMVPLCEYEELKNYWLDEEENKAIIETVENFQKGFMTHIHETFENCEKNDIQVSIKANSGLPLATGTYENSDGIVNMKYSCGATCAPLGETFPDDYKQKVDTGYNNISPDRTIDLSTGYYPERTWVVNYLYHGMVEWDERPRKLVEKLLFTREIKDAYSHYEFPQFMETSAPNNDLDLRFTCTNTSFIALKDGKILGNTIVIKNNSKSSSMLLKNISCDENMTINASLPITLEPGEEINVTFTLKDTSKETYGSVTLTYSDGIAITSNKTRTIAYTATENYSGVVIADKEDTTVTQNSFWDVILDAISKVISFVISLISKISK